MRILIIFNMYLKLEKALINVYPINKKIGDVSDHGSLTCRSLVERVTVRARGDRRARPLCAIGGSHLSLIIVQIKFI